MKTTDIYFRTLKFVWIKLGLGMLTVLLSVLLLAIMMGMGTLFGGDTAYFICLVIWLSGTGAIHTLINHYFGYLVKAGHVAIIANAIVTGQIPDNQVEVATNIVKERFVTSTAFFAVDRLISGAVSQIQNTLQQVDNLLGNIPGISLLISFAKVFVSMSLNYVDECCLGYTFLHCNENPFKCAADGVVIYFQNWKKLLKNAAFMSIAVIIGSALAWFLPFLLFGSVFTLFSWPRWIAVFPAALVAMIIKYAFIDSYMLIKMMVSYLEVAPYTQITFDLYEKLSKISRKFKELLNKGTPTPQAY